MTTSAVAPQPHNGEPGSPNWLAKLTPAGGSLIQAILLPTLALLTALVIGALVIAVTDVPALRLFNDSPREAIGEMISGSWNGIKALFVGAVGSPRAISETLFAATPLILAGLAVAVGFQAGLFNIGVAGQMHIGGMVALWLGFTLHLPTIIHIPLTLVGAMVGGGLWAGITGFLKAKTGAHEVITTIMFNFVALFLVDYLLTTTIFQETGRADPISKPAADTAHYPRILGESFRLHIGFLIALAAIAFVYWLLFKSSIGFEFRTVGFNPQAGRYAGMKVAWIYVSVMAISGALAGLAGSNQVLGLEPYRALGNFAANTGFDAIALALLARSHPIGVLWAGLLFGGLRAGGRQMQGAAGIPIDLVLVMQALIIVFIAAPNLVRAIYRIKQPKQTGATQLTTGWGG